MVHKRASSGYRSLEAGDPSPKLTTKEAIALLQDEKRLTGYDKAFLLGLMTEVRDYAEKFKYFRGRPKVTIFGSARTKENHPDYITAHDFSKKMATVFDYDVITGAGPGIMEAGNRGAGLERAIGLNISLPFEQKANPYLKDERLITFYYFMIRKLGFVRESDAIVLCPGGFGTLDEGFEALTLIQTGCHVPVPVVLLEHEDGTFWEPFKKMAQHMVEQGTVSEVDLDLFYHTKNIDDAINYINAFYYTYHSLRYLDDDRAVIRLNRDISSKRIEHLYQQHNVLFKSKITHHSHALPDEQDEPDIAHLSRLEFKIDFTKPVDLYMFIRDLNEGSISANTAKEAHLNPRPARVKIDGQTQ